MNMKFSNAFIIIIIIHTLTSYDNFNKNRSQIEREVSEWFDLLRLAMNKFYVYAICLAMAFSACKEKQHNEDTFRVLEIGDPVTLPDLSDLFDKVELIFLENRDSALFYNVKKFYITESRYFLFCSRNYTVYSFDRDGRFLFNTSHLRGQGAGYFAIVTDFLLNPVTGNMEFLDPYGNIYVYDTSSVFIDKIALPKEIGILNDFQSIGDSLYMFYQPKFENDLNSTIWVYSKVTGKLIVKQPFKELYPRGFVSGDPLHFFNDGKCQYFAAGRQDNNLYRIEPQSEGLLYPEYAIRFKDRPLSPKVLGDDPRRFLKNREETGYSILCRKIIGDKYWIITYALNNNGYIYILNRQSDQFICFNHKFKSGNMMLDPIYVDNEYLYSIVDPAYLSAIFPDYKFDGQTEKKVRALTEGDNFIIVKYRFKKDLLSGI